VVQEYVAAFSWYILGHFINKRAVHVKRNLIGCPVEPIFVELLIRPEGQVLDLEFICPRCIISVSYRFRSLEDEVYGTLGLVELLREELEVDLLGVVVELRYVSLSLFFMSTGTASYVEECSACSI
jgi:hypothetical protein